MMSLPSWLHSKVLFRLSHNRNVENTSCHEKPLRSSDQTTTSFTVLFPTRFISILRKSRRNLGFFKQASKIEILQKTKNYHESKFMYTRLKVKVVRHVLITESMVKVVLSILFRLRKVWSRLNIMFRLHKVCSKLGLSIIFRLHKVRSQLGLSIMFRLNEVWSKHTIPYLM